METSKVTGENEAENAERHPEMMDDPCAKIKKQINKGEHNQSEGRNEQTNEAREADSSEYLYAVF